MPAFDEGRPLFVQIAEQLADDIVDGQLAEGTRVPSTNELAVDDVVGQLLGDLHEQRRPLVERRHRASRLVG